MRTRAITVYMLDGSVQKRYFRPSGLSLYEQDNRRVIPEVHIVRTTSKQWAARVRPYGAPPTPWFELKDDQYTTQLEMLRKWQSGALLAELMLR